MGLRMVIMGGPGAGKGTQAERIARVHELPHISTGDILRDEIKQETELGRAVKDKIESGHLAPDNLVCKIVSNRLERPDCRGGYVLDGFPRTRAQAESLDNILRERDENLNLVINLKVDDEVIVRRLAARRMCPICGAIYNLIYKKPRKENRCDNPACDGAQLFQRADDQEDTIRKRLKVYHLEEEPILDFYTQEGILRNVEGSQCSPDDVFAKIENLINANDVACT